MTCLEPGSYPAMRRQFAAQFDEEDGRLVFRANGSGPAILVTATERDAFIMDYDRFLSRWRWQMIFWIIPGILVAGIVMFAVGILDGPMIYVGIFAGIAPGLIVSIRSAYRARDMPKRELADRALVAPALPKDVARRKVLGSIPWPGLALGPAYTVYLMWRYHALSSPFAPNHMFWTLAAGGMIVLCAVQAMRKWRAGRVDAAVA